MRRRRERPAAGDPRFARPRSSRPPPPPCASRRRGLGRAHPPPSGGPRSARAGPGPWRPPRGPPHPDHQRRRTVWAGGPTTVGRRRPARVLNGGWLGRVDGGGDDLVDVLPAEADETAVSGFPLFIGALGCACGQQRNDGAVADAAERLDRRDADLGAGSSQLFTTAGSAAASPRSPSASSRTARAAGETPSSAAASSAVILGWAACRVLPVRRRAACVPLRRRSA